MSRAEVERGNDRRSELPEHVDRETVSIRLSILAGPKAIRLIALDTVNRHQGPARTQPNKIASL
jgi:hypothetical protein